VEDDLRNAVWRGGLLGFQAADVMLHVPFDPAFAAQQDQVAIVAPYARERFGWPAPRARASNAKAAPVAFKGHKLAVEVATIPDYYLMGLAALWPRMWRTIPMALRPFRRWSRARRTPPWRPMPSWNMA
jgi:hypothetical protein